MVLHLEVKSRLYRTVVEGVSGILSSSSSKKDQTSQKQYVEVRFLLFQLCIENWQFITPYVSMRRGSVTVMDSSC